MIDVQISIELSECLVIELPYIIRDNGMGELEVANDGLLKEGFDLAFRYVCQEFCLCPLGDVIDGDE